MKVSGDWVEEMIYLLFFQKYKMWKFSWRKLVQFLQFSISYYISFLCIFYYRNAVLLYSRNWKIQYVCTKCYITHKISIIKSSEHGNPFSTRFILPCLWIRNFRKHMHFRLFPSIDSWFFCRYVNGPTTVHQETINDAINAINWYFTMCLFRR